MSTNCLQQTFGMLLHNMSFVLSFRLISVSVWVDFQYVHGCILILQLFPTPYFSSLTYVALIFRAWI